MKFSLLVAEKTEQKNYFILGSLPALLANIGLGT
jgi:hypothetical protein